MLYFLRANSIDIYNCKGKLSVNPNYKLPVKVVNAPPGLAKNVSSGKQNEEFDPSLYDPLQRLPSDVEQVGPCDQCDQMVRLFFNIWPFVTMKISPKCHKFAKAGSGFSQIRNKPSKNWPRLINFCQRGKNLPNLVTVPVTHQSSNTSTSGFLTKITQLARP